MLIHYKFVTKCKGSHIDICKTERLKINIQQEGFSSSRSIQNSGFLIFLPRPPFMSPLHNHNLRVHLSLHINSFFFWGGGSKILPINYVVRNGQEKSSYFPVSLLELPATPFCGSCWKCHQVTDNLWQLHNPLLKACVHAVWGKMKPPHA